MRRREEFAGLARCTACDLIAFLSDSKELAYRQHNGQRDLLIQIHSCGRLGGDELDGDACDC